MSDELRTLLGERLRVERDRLGLNQSDFAALGGASKRSQIDWEKGALVPNAEFLALVAGHGVDVLFVLTGERSKPPESLMTSDEVEMLDSYRRSSPVRQASLREVGSACASASSSALNSLDVRAPRAARTTINVGGDVGQSVAGDQVIHGAVHIGAVKKR